MIATFQQKLGTTKVKQKFCLSQIIKEPTLNEMSPCIDLCFTTQPNLVTESGVICSLHSYCHHNLKLNKKIYYLPTYECRLWYYKKANSHHISHAIVKFSWESICKSKCKWSMYSLKDIKDILSNFIPHETIIFDHNDLPCINSKMKGLVQEKN